MILDQLLAYVKFDDDDRARLVALHGKLQPEPFFSTKHGGTGMGMSIVHNFVAMHGGRIDIASSPRGTLIDVAMPRSRH